MNPIVYHVASGQSFFTGVVLLLLGGFFATRQGCLWRRLATLAVVLGVVAIAISSTPLPYWLLAICVLATIVWLVAIATQRWQGYATAGLCLAWSVAAVWEASYLTMPRLPLNHAQAVTVIGDSVTAGTGETSITTWPALLASEHQLQVQDLSRVGIKTADAVKIIKQQPIKNPLVLVEIGGNDLLGGESASEFRDDLDALLGQLCSGNRQVVMLELPLMPLCGDFGRAQRSLAARHGVCLVPKRVFLSVLAADGATVDTIHLSAAGHQRMCDTLWRILQSSADSAR
jgi:acyl-CoA thioesterase-1